MEQSSYRRRIKKPFSCYLEPRQIERLREIHIESRIPMSVLIREGIDIVIERYDKKKENSG